MFVLKLGSLHKAYQTPGTLPFERRLKCEVQTKDIISGGLST